LPTSAVMREDQLLTEVVLTAAFMGFVQSR
jgi:hypothetical protein